MRRLGVIAAVAVFVAALAAGGLWIYRKLQFGAPGPLREQAVVMVPRGAGLATIAKDLAAAGVIEDTYIFRVGVRLFGDARALQAGEYAFTSGMSMKDAAELIASGQTVVHRLTVPEGLTSAEIIDLLAAEIGTASCWESVIQYG